MTKQDETEMVAAELQRHMRIVPWRKADRLLFLGILVVSIVNLALIVITVVYTT